MTSAQIADVPRYEGLMWPTVQALTALGGSGSIDEINEKVIELEQFPIALQEIRHTDGRHTALTYRLAWARSYLKKINAVVNSERGIWTLTPVGCALTEAECTTMHLKVRKGERTRACQNARCEAVG